ncbi:hypothetical protein CBL_01403 [Carabus blaptoides fortunei]
MEHTYLESAGEQIQGTADDIGKQWGLECRCTLRIYVFDAIRFDWCNINPLTNLSTIYIPLFGLCVGEPLSPPKAAPPVTNPAGSYHVPTSISKFICSLSLSVKATTSGKEMKVNFEKHLQGICQSMRDLTKKKINLL